MQKLIYGVGVWELKPHSAAMSFMPSSSLMKGVSTMKTHWAFRLYIYLIIGISLIHLLPFLFVGKYYVFMIYYTTFPFPILFTPLFDTLVRNLLAQILISVIASSCVWSLIVTAIVTAVYSLLKRQQPKGNGEQQ